MAFDPKRHTIKVQGNREYLPVSARLVWFRSDHPDWGIVTTPVEINLHPENNRPAYAIFSATILNAEGKVMATATKMEDQRGFPDFIEKAETGSVGRALAYCGYGTQFAPELEEGSRLADAPYGGGGNYGNNRFASGGNGRPPMGGNNGRPANGPMNGGRDAAPPMQQRSAAPAQRPAPPTPEDDDPFGDEAPAATPPAAATPAPARPATPPAASSNSNGNSGGITRVREPERETFDPGGSDDDDEGEDPFADEEDIPAAAPSRPAARAEEGSTVLTNKCSADGCPMPLTAAQVTMSMQKYGKALCLKHQRDAVPVGAAAPASNGAGRRTAKSGSTGDLQL